MKYGVLAFVAAVLAVPAAQAQGMWWVEGDRFCSDYGNNSRNNAMCGNPRKGENEPRPSYRYQFNFPRVPFLQGGETRQDSVPAPTDRPAAAPGSPTTRRRQQ
jgi:hypothetical protein